MMVALAEFENSSRVDLLDLRCQVMVMLIMGIWSKNL